MRINIPYGTDSLDIKVPDMLLQEVFSPNRLVTIENPEQEIENAIMFPIASKPLRDLLYNG